MPFGLDTARDQEAWVFAVGQPGPVVITLTASGAPVVVTLRSPAGRAAEQQFSHPPLSPPAPRVPQSLRKG